MNTLSHSHTFQYTSSLATLGGQFNMAKLIPGKEEFYETLRYFKKQLTLTGSKHPYPPPSPPPRHTFLINIQYTHATHIHN